MVFAEAWIHPNANSHAKWQEAIGKKFASMNKQQVWHKTSKNLMTHNQGCAKSKWVFKIRHNGVYPMCLLACGYSLVPDIDFSENYSPVVNAISFCVLLLMVLHFGYAARSNLYGVPPRNV